MESESFFSYELMAPYLNLDQEESLYDIKCIICQSEAIVDPVLCSNCYRIFCAHCIVEWTKSTSRSTCPFKCSTTEISFISGKQKVRYIIERLKFNCFNGCGESVTLKEASEHFLRCKSEICNFTPKCRLPKKFRYKEVDCCSLGCFTAHTVSSQTSPAFIFNFPMSWNLTSSSFLIERDSTLSTTKDLEDFHTLVSEVELIKGQYIFRVKAKRVSDHFKIGFTSNKEVGSLKGAFSDHRDSISFYTIGQSRENSDEFGEIVGEPIDIEKPISFEVVFCSNLKWFAIRNETKFTKNIIPESMYPKEGQGYFFAVAFIGSVEKFSVESQNYVD